MSDFADLFDRCRERGLELEVIVGHQAGSKGREHREVVGLRAVPRVGRQPLAAVGCGGLDGLDEAAFELRGRLPWKEA